MGERALMSRGFTPRGWVGLLIVGVSAALLTGVTAVGQVGSGEDRPDRVALPSALAGAVGLSSARAEVSPVAMASGRFMPRGELTSNLAHARAIAGMADGAHALVQLAQPVDELKWRALENLGVRLMGHLPERTYLAALPGELSAAGLRDAGVTWVGAVYPEDKSSRRVREQGVGVWALEADGTARLRIKYYEDVSSEFAAEEALRLGAVAVERVDALDELRVRVAPDLLEVLLGLDWVRWVEDVPPPPIAMNDGVRASTGVELVMTWPDGLTGAGVAMGMWDEGHVDGSHGDFGGRVILAEPDGVVALHATHVGGTMAGDGSRSTAFGGGAGQWRGVAPGMEVVSYDFEEPIEEHDEAINVHGIVGSQNSWGFRILGFLRNCDLYGAYSHYAPEYDRIIGGLYGRPVSVVFAAGNYRQGSGTNDCAIGPYGTIGPPGTAKNVLTVGAIRSDDNGMTFFSSWGPVADGRLKPELVAPGAQGGGDGGVTSTVPGNGYAMRQGTSMAAPSVSGAVGLLVEDYRNRNNQTEPMPSMVRALLVHSAEDLDAADGVLNLGPDFASGYGRLQIPGAIEQLRGNGYLVGSVEAGGNKVYGLDVVEGTSEVKLTLAWDDPAAVENAAITLVNDLDLVVLDPEGRRHYPWTLDPEQPTAPAVRTRSDHLNVIEQVLVDGAVVPGQWEIRISGEGIRGGGPQRFSLVFSPVGIPAAASLETIAREITDGPPGMGNGNGSIDPGETIALEVLLENLGGLPATNVTIRLQSMTPGVTVVEPVASYPDLLVGDRAVNLTPLLVRVDKQVACGELIEFREVIEAGGVVITNHFQLVIGRVGVINRSVAVFESNDGPVTIPDRGSMVSPLPVPVIGSVTGVQVSVRIDHPWHGDLRLELEHPDGTRVRLVEASGNSGANFGSGPCGAEGGRTEFDDAATDQIQGGGAPFVGVYRPLESLGRFVGKPTEGVWGLRVSDVAAEDQGVLLCWGLTLAYEEEGFICDLFNRAPVVVSDRVSVVYETARWIWLPGLDPDGDATTFAITVMPQHGTLSDLDPESGWVQYRPAEGYIGSDAFGFVVSDGFVTSEPAEMVVDVMPPSVDLAVELLSPKVTGLSQVMTLVLRVSNRGPNDSREALLTYHLPAGVSLLSVDRNGGDYSVLSDQVLIELGDVGVWTSDEVRLHLQPSETGPATHRAEVASAESDWDLSNNAASGITDVLIDNDLVVGLSVGALEGLVGRELEYTIGVTNLGPHEAEMVEVAVEWFGKVELVSVEPSQGDWVEEGGVVRFEVGEMGVGGEAEVRMVVRALEDGQLTNVVRVVSGELDLVPENNVVEGVVRVDRLVDLGLVQEVGALEVLMGQVWRIGVGVTNAGPSVASGVRVMDELGLGMEVMEVEVSQGEWTNGIEGLEWAVGTLGVGEGAGMEMWVRVMVEGWSTNVVRVIGDEVEGDESDNESRLEVLVVPAADLGLDLGGEPGATVVLGTETSYGILVRNGGPSEATGVVLEGRLGEGMELVSVGWEEGKWSEEDGLVRCELGLLGVGEEVEVGLVVLGMEEGVWTNRFEVHGVEADGAGENNMLEWVSVVRKETDLAVGLWVGALEGLVGRELEYTIGVTNLGPHEAEMVEVAVEWFGKVELVSVEPSQGDWVQTASHLVWTLGDLGATGEAEARVVIVPLRNGEVLSEVVGTTATFDMVPENNVSSVRVTIFEPAELVLEQTANRAPVMVGDQLTYTISVWNLADYVVSDVRLVDELPAGVELVSTKISQGIISNTVEVIEWSLGAMAPGSSASVLVTVVPQQAGWLTNRVELMSAYVDPEDPGLVGELVIESVTTPPMTITAEGSRVVLAWPAIAQGYVLQVSDELTTPMIWVFDGNPQELAGDRITVTVKVTNGRRYYRLVQP
jgi:uncharacterized repeat protein (TIGR01451 family)